MYLKAKIVVIFCLFVYVQAETCPPEPYTQPCECYPELGLTLECRNMTDATDLDVITRRTGNITFQKLRMFNSSIKSIPTNTLKQKQFKSIEIFDTKLQSLFDGVDESSNVRSLDLLNVEFNQKFPWGQLKPLKNLRVFVAKRGFIPELADEFKNNVNKELAILELSDTYTRSISEGVLTEYGELREIVVENCGLRIVKRSYFPRPAAKLFELKLDGNAIATLPDDIFEDMPKLEFVSLQRNKLTAISGAVFKSMDHQLRSLHLEKNPIKCDCDLKWIVSPNKPSYDLFGKCYSGPDWLRDKELQDLKSEDFGSCH